MNYSKGVQPYKGHDNHLRKQPNAYGAVEGQAPQNLEDIVYATNNKGYEFRALDKDRFDKFLNGPADDPEAFAFAKLAIEEAVRSGPISRDYDFWRGVQQEDSQTKRKYNRVAGSGD